MINRRKVVQGIGATAVAHSRCRRSLRAQELRKIRMGFGIKSVNPIVINILIAEQLGYTKEEGLQFTPAAARHQRQRADRARQGRQSSSASARRASSFRCSPRASCRRS